MTMTTPIDAARPMHTPRAEVSSESASHGAFATRHCELVAAVASSKGDSHAVNEDCHSALDGRAPLFVVADGVGGGALASAASRQLVSHLHSALSMSDATPTDVRAALIDADRAIARSIASRTDARGAATVALCKARGASLARWVIGWVGDCRVYRLAVARDAELLTSDDSYRRLDEAPPLGGSPDDPARMVGNGAVDVPNVREITLRAGEMLLLASDGVHRHVTTTDMGRVMHAPTPLVHRCRTLVELARVGGSRDDATVLVVRRIDRKS
jgi:protein phosphatase